MICRIAAPENLADGDLASHLHQAITVSAATFVRKFDVKGDERKQPTTRVLWLPLEYLIETA